MMRQYELVEKVLSYDPTADEDLLNRAYVYAMKAHGNQKRASGEAYFNHPVEVAAILADMKLDDATIAAALLHDTVEDTETTSQEIQDKFGHDIAVLVDGLTKIKQLDRVTKVASGDVERCAGVAGEAGGPFAQHAHVAACEAGKAFENRRRNHGYLCTLGRPHGHAVGAR
jgi:(p)ppGpp synthase/HD superfamily hydrolase